MLTASVYFNLTTNSKKVQNVSHKVSTSNNALVTNKKIIAARKEIHLENKSAINPLPLKLNNKANEFIIEHKNLPVTHNSIQNDINIDLMKTTEAVSFISKKEETTQNEKQIIVKEENAATGEIVTKSYQLIKRNGIWESSLLWVITEKPSDLNIMKSGNSEHSVQ
jgi:hypothetical protein